MRRPIRTASILLIVGIVLVGATRSLALSLIPVYGLRGLDSVSMEFLVLDDTPVPETESDIPAAVTAALTRAGVRVLASDECHASRSCANIYIYVRGAPGSSGQTWAYVVDLELTQAATLTRDPKLDIGGELTTYRQSRVGLARRDRLHDAVKAVAIDLSRGLAQVIRLENTK